jgi:hypothetical protein
MWNSDDDYDIQSGALYDEILEEEEVNYEERQDGNYYIGLPYYDNAFDELLLTSSVRSETFFSYPIENITHYLKYYSVIRTEELDTPEIMQLMIHPTSDAYNVVLKTHWIRLIQRTWKNVMLNRKNIIKQWAHPDALKQREIQGKSTIVLPSFRGMMAYLKVNK